MALLTHGKDKRAETTRRLQFALSSANQTQNTTEIQSGILRTLNDFQRNKISHYIRKMFLWKQSWGEDFFFLCRKWQHLKLFQATEIFLLKQRGITALMGAQNPVQLLGRSNSRSSNHSRASLEATWRHQPALKGTSWNQPKEGFGGFFCRFPEKAQRTPQVQLQGKRGDRWDEAATKEILFSVASTAPQPLYSCQNELWRGLEIKISEYLSQVNLFLNYLFTTVWIADVISHCQWMKTPLCTAEPAFDLHKALKCFIFGLEVQVRTKPLPQTAPLSHRAAPAISFWQQHSCSNDASCHLTPKNTHLDF